MPDEKYNGLGRVHDARKACQKKRPIIYLFSDDFGVKEPRYSEKLFAKKRYTLIPLSSFRKHFRQKKVYLSPS